MPNPLFTVDRRPCVHLSLNISTTNNTFWSGNADLCEAVIDDATGNRISGVTASSNIGVQMYINAMQYHWERGIRRFIINSPCGSLDNGVTDIAYAGILGPMKERKVQRENGVFVPNPYKACWKGNSYTVPDLATIDSAPFIANAQYAQWFTLLRAWLLGINGYTTNKLDIDPVEIYLYTSFVIPLGPSSTPITSRNWVKYPGDTNNATFVNQANGFAFPDPDNVAAHQTYLQNEFRPWYECGICGVGADVGLYAWNHRKGDWVYFNNPTKPANFDTPKTNMKKWFNNEYFSLTRGIGTGQRLNMATKFTYFQEIHPWDIDKNNITNRTETLDFPKAGTEEAFALLDPWGSNGDSNSTAFKGSWMHYSPYIIADANMTSWINGNWANATTSYNGADPNRKWQFDKATTEIHLLVPSLAKPFTNNTDPTLTSLSASISDPATQSIIDDCVDWWMDYIDRGYVYQPVLYQTSYLVEREINKRILQNLGVWPLSDPAA